MITRTYIRPNGLKTIPSPAAHTRTANIWEYPLLPRGPGSGRVFTGSGISLKKGVGLEFDCSWEAGFTKIGHGMGDSNKRRKWDAEF